MVGLSSAAGIVSLLAEQDPDLQSYALEKLNENIDSLWTEVAGSIGDIEALYEDDSFPERQLAALVASKVYYNLQEYNESMNLALGAGKLFDIEKEGEYEDTIVSKCIDTYIALSAAANPDTSLGTSSTTLSQLSTSFAGNNGAASTSATLSSPTTPFTQSTLPSKSLLSRQDSIGKDNAVSPADGLSGASQLPSLPGPIRKQLRAVIERLFERCYQSGRYKQVVGIAIEARDLRKLHEAILKSRQHASRSKKVVSEADQTEEIMDYVLDICMTVVQERGLRNEILDMILDLLEESSTRDYFAIAKCIVYLNEDEKAVQLLTQLIKKDTVEHRAIAYQIAFDMYDNSTQEFLKKVREALPAQETSNGDTESEESAQPPFVAIGSILDGTKSIDLDLEFLYRNDHTDKQVLNKIKDSLEARNSIFHTAVSLANAFMHAGTTNDKFFRDNLEWLGKAVNWSKFTATAALGVIHRGNLRAGQKLLEPYLPRANIAGANAGSAYSQGGSLYALGLIYANHEGGALETIRKHFKETEEEVVQHGGALGLGVAGMATGDKAIYEELKVVLYANSAINGEAVGIAIGLIMLGTADSEVLTEMIQYAHETEHEKIVRGLATGMALIMYARQEAADELINGLLEDPDPILRYGGIQTIALAYCGSGSNKAVRKLLHVAVSDVSDDVRRIAVMSLGFILFRKPNSVPRMVELLSESYNPHVRYGAAMALGISCAGTGLDLAIDLLEPMIKDPTDFVRQGALIALSMIMVQQNEAMNPKVGTVRKTLQKAIGDRHEDAMTKFGSAVSLGIIDAGGRNCTISLQTQTGNLNMAGIVGMSIFTQYWYWFPLTHFLSLSFTPTSMIGIDEDLEVPLFKFHSATRPSLFDYPPEQEAKVEDAPEKVKTAVLSTTARAKRRAQRKEKEKGGDGMDIDPTTPKIGSDDKMDTDEVIKDEEKKEGEEKKPEKKKAEKEKVGYDLENMSRVLPEQLKYLSFNDPRYEPVKKPTGGVVVVIDKKPSDKKTLIELKARTKAARAAPAPNTSGSSNLLSSLPPNLLQSLSGAAAAAGILNAIDEDEEDDGEDAPLPRTFEYESEDEGREEDN